MEEIIKNTIEVITTEEVNVNVVEESKLYKVLKVKMKDFETEEVIARDADGNKKLNKKKEEFTEIKTLNTIKIITKDIEYTNRKEETKIFTTKTIKNKSIRQYYTLLKENDVIRIIRALDLANNNNISDNYKFIKDIITVDVKVGIYQKETKDAITLRYEEYGTDEKIKVDADGKKLITEVKYKRLMASSGNIRNKKVVFIREELFEKANEILLCGLPSDMKYPQMSKFNAYYALANTDSTPVTMPRMVVIDDYETPIMETFDVVRPKFTVGEDGKKIRIKDEYTCNAEENYSEIIKPFDGAGLVDISLAKIWSEELGLDYIPSYFQFRAIAGIKGNVIVMDIRKYAINFKSRTGKKAIINDAYENPIEILDKDGKLIKDVILTKSQFKFYSKYKEFGGKDGFKIWEENFKKEIHGFNRTFNIAKYGVDFKDIKNKVLLSYQPLQTLSLSEPQIESMCSETVKMIKNISTNVDEFLKYRGLVDEFETEQNKKTDVLVPQYYIALKKNKELFNDKFIQDKIKEDIKGFKERSYKACIITDGCYQVLMPDVVGLIQYAFGEKVVGCLKANEIYSSYWVAKKENKVDLIRFPHIANEHRIVNVVNPVFAKDCDWLQYIGEGIVTSLYDSNALAANSADFDGDKIMQVSTKEILEQVEIVNTIIFDDVKEEKQTDENVIEAKEEEVPKINDIDKIIETDVLGMSNDIGAVVNKISQLWSIIPKDDVEKEKIHEMIKIMSIIGSLTIDFVKTGIKSPIPPSIIKFIHENKVLKPDFMKWKYTKIAKDERTINRNKRLLGQKEVIELFGQTKCTVNEISWYMQEKVKGIEVEADKNEVFDYSNFINEKDFNVRAEGYLKTLDIMLELKKEEDKIGYLQNKDTDDYMESEDNTEQYTLFYAYAKNKLMSIVANKSYKLDKEKMLDYLIYIVTNIKEFKEYNNMNLIWNTWGKELTRRLDNKEIIIKDLNEKEILERTEELKTKIKKKNEIKDKVFIEMFNPKAKEEDKKEIEIFDGEIKDIKKIEDIKNKRLALTLLILDKFCKVYGKIFNIANNKKSIKRYNIYQLAEINHKNIDECFKKLLDSKVIILEEKDKGKVLGCKVNIEPKGTVVKTIKDVNHIKKLFKLIA